jgi:hypothetical protein
MTNENANWEDESRPCESQDVLVASTTIEATKESMMTMTMSPRSRRLPARRRRHRYCHGPRHCCRYRHRTGLVGWCFGVCRRNTRSPSCLLLLGLLVLLEHLVQHYSMMVVVLVLLLLLLLVLVLLVLLVLLLIVQVCQKHSLESVVHQVLGTNRSTLEEAIPPCGIDLVDMLPLLDAVNNRRSMGSTPEPNNNNHKPCDNTPLSYMNIAFSSEAADLLRLIVVAWFTHY